ncbi:hypothetical protein PJ311_01635 [Bacillus sp. CLL-7-23]|uniref:Uncharacterized protein n=1 Tax=Bacillus changyiensis TaxID=3004103 RepID=A0ABT4WZ35_9BACI|nr:hypothetical protein [Bacillus changyiensis]MDA7025308.1 hypothetical protein [Bacillus changyiensis]
MINVKESLQEKLTPLDEENFAKGCLSGIVISLPIWFMIYLFFKYVIIK